MQEHCPAVRAWPGSAHRSTGNQRVGDPAPVWSRPIKPGSATICCVLMPLPTMTASAEAASSSIDCARTVTPFIEVTSVSGQQIVTRQSGFLIRLRTPKAISESSSLNPWKVRMAICMVEILRPAPRLLPAEAHIPPGDLCESTTIIFRITGWPTPHLVHGKWLRGPPRTEGELLCNTQWAGAALRNHHRSHSTPPVVRFACGLGTRQTRRTARRPALFPGP